MTFGQAIASGFKNYANFNGRTSRSGYWWWALFTFLVTLPFIIWFLADLIATTISIGGGAANQWVFVTSTPSFIVLALVQLAFVLPHISIQVRRLHDINMSGAWWWIQLVPSVGSIVIFVFALLPSVNEGNRYN